MEHNSFGIHKSLVSNDSDSFAVDVNAFDLSQTE